MEVDYQSILLGAVIAERIFERAYKLFNKNGRNAKALKTAIKCNPHPPGEAKECKENRDMIIELRTDMKNVKEDIAEITRRTRI